MKTQRLGNMLFVQDLNNNNWSLYDTNGIQAAQATEELSASPLILLQVNYEERSASFLSPKGNDKALMTTVKF